ncbi:hypothetical protein EKH55_3114 [Sinorhizobium alkalisoli]|nr:hypothetical protein EKH55_3114 [Sinorhizobium alkalisoli]
MLVLAQSEKKAPVFRMPIGIPNHGVECDSVRPPTDRIFSIHERPAYNHICLKRVRSAALHILDNPLHEIHGMH